MELARYISAGTIIDLLLFNAEQRLYGRGDSKSGAVLGGLFEEGARREVHGRAGFMAKLSLAAQKRDGADALIRIVAEEFVATGGKFRLSDIPMNGPRRAQVIAELILAAGVMGAGGEASELLAIWRLAEGSDNLAAELGRCGVEYRAAREQIGNLRARLPRPELVLAHAPASVWAELLGDLIENRPADAWRGPMRLGLQMIYEGGVRRAMTAEAFIPMVAAKLGRRCDKMPAERLMMAMYYLNRPVEGDGADALREILPLADSEAIGQLLAHSILWLRANGDAETRLAWRPTLSWLATLGGNRSLRADVLRMSILRVWPTDEIFRPEEWYDLW